MRHPVLAALFAGLVALPATASAQSVLYDRAGDPVAVLVPRAALSVPLAAWLPPPDPMLPVADLLAGQDALFRQVVAEMQALDAAMPLPEQLPAFAAAPGTTVMVSSVTTGNGTCSRTVTYQAHGEAAPLVQVRQTGNACDPLPSTATRTTPAVVPEPARPAPHVIHVDYRRAPRAPVSLRG